MAERVILAYRLVDDDVFPQEITPASDTITIAGLTMHASGTGITMNTHKITGLGSATADGDALAYGQSGANLAGLDIDTSPLTMNSQKITGLGAATTDDDALAYGQTGASLQDLTITGTVTNDGHVTTKEYVDAKVLTGASMKEAILHDNQLDDTDGINAAVALTMASNPVSGDTVVLSDGSTTRTYGADSGGDVQFTIGATVADTMANLVTAIEGDGSSIWGAVFTTDLDGIDSDGVVVIIEDANSGTAPYIYGTWGTQANCQIVDFTDETAYTKKTTSNLPSSAPASSNFGFRRTVANLTDGEVHNALESDTLYAWDDNADTWQYYSGLSSIPDATAASGGGTKGKITVDSDYGLDVSSGILTINLESDGAIVFDAANDGLEVNLESSNPTLQISTNELGVKYDTASGLDTSASGLAVQVEADGAIVFDGTNGGLEVNLETTNPTLEISTNELGVKFGSSAGLDQDANGLLIKVASANELSLDSSGLNVEGVPTLFNIGATAVGATVTAPNLDTLTDGSNADALHVHASAPATEAPKVENTIAVDEAVAAGDPLYFTSTGDRVGKALANTIAKSYVIGVARLAQGTVGQTTEVVTTGPCAGVLSSATPGARYWLQGTGGIGTTRPGSGERLVLVGAAQNASDLFVHILDFGLRG